MASIIKAGNATDGVQVSSDATGALDIKTGTGAGTTAISIDASQAVTMPGNLTLTGGVVGDLKFDSGYGSIATAYGCRAWVNFNGTGTVAIRASGNVSSITDNGTGNYQVNMATAMPDANYAFFVNGIQNASGSFYNAPLQQRGSTRTVSSLNIENLLITGAASAAAYDISDVTVAIFR
jgi:hypothetical protein